MKKHKIYLSVVLVFLIVIGTIVVKSKGNSGNVEAQKQEKEIHEKKEGKDIPWYLTLVGPNNELNTKSEIQLKTLNNGQKVDERIHDDLMNMLANGKKAGMDLIVCSSYRTQEKQESLFNKEVTNYLNKGEKKEEAEKKAAMWVAKPGTSEHQLGLAVDIVSVQYQLLNEKQADTKEQKWLMDHCHEYGFILRYPKEKTNVTSVNYEPWHYRYVGKEVAKELYEQNLTLEEYLDSNYKI